MYEYITYDKVFYNMKSPSAITAETLKSIKIISMSFIVR